MSKSLAQVRFPRPSKGSFSQVLSTRVREYFKDNDLSSKGDIRMFWKTLGMLALYFVPYVLLLSVQPEIWLMFVLFSLMGLGMTGIGMGVMHDAAHGAYHHHNFVNKLVGSSIYLISGNLATWKIQHNVLHHTYTNIEGLDEDMETSGLIRLHPSQKWKKMHRFQKFYSPLVYGLLTLNWVVAKDFKQLLRYYRRGIGGYSKQQIRREWAILVFTKALYFGLFIALPIIVLPVAWYWVVLGFVWMHMIAGTVLSFVFQLAHMVEDVDNLEAPEAGELEDEWMAHQLKTTANFGRRNRLVSWFVGGLNYQIEHHLFPNICHIHYPNISKIVRETAAEFELPYFEYQRVRDALAAHMRHLANMSRPVPALA